VVKQKKNTTKKNILGESGVAKVKRRMRLTQLKLKKEAGIKRTGVEGGKLVLVRLL